MSSTAQATFEPAHEIARVFDLQREHQWEIKATKVDERKAKLARLKAAVEAHADDIVAAVREDTRKPEGEIRVTEVLNVLGNIQLNIDSLEEWMKPTDVTPSPTLNTPYGKVASPNGCWSSRSIQVMVPPPDRVLPGR